MTDLKALTKAIPWYAVAFLEKALRRRANYYPLTSNPSLQRSLALR